MYDIKQIFKGNKRLSFDKGDYAIMVRYCVSCNKEIEIWNYKSVFLIDGEQSFVCDDCLKSYRLFYKNYKSDRDQLDNIENDSDYFNIDTMLPRNCKLIKRRYTYFMTNNEFEEFKNSIISFDK